MSELYVNVEYDARTDAVQITGNVKPAALEDFITNFLRTQMGSGKDTHEAERRDVYHVKLTLDPSDDSYESFSDTGNMGLRDGILLYALGSLKRGTA